MKFINFMKLRKLDDLASLFTFKPGVEDREIIKVYMITLGNQGTYYTRMIKSFINEMAIIGGLSRTLFYGFLVLTIFFVKPFKNLRLAVSF